MVVRFREQFLNALAVAAICRDADARGENRLFRVAGENFADAVGNTTRFVLLRLREDQGEFVAAVSRGGIDGPAMNAEHIGETADSAAAHEMAKAVVDFFQAIEIKKQNGEGPAVAIGAIGFGFQDIEQTAVISESGERIAHGEMANLFEEPRIVEKSPAQGDGVAQHHERLRENERSVQQASGLSSRKLSGKIQPGGRINGAVEGRILDGQAATEPDEAHEENRGGQQLLRIREKSVGMARNFGRKAAKRNRNHIGQPDYGQQSAGDFPAWMTRTRQETLNQKRHHQQKGQDKPAKPPSKWRPEQAERGFRKDLKKENAGRRQNGTGEKESSAKYQGDAVLSPLKTDQGNSGENKGEKSADDLQVALKDGVWLKGDAAKPVSSENHQ